MIKKLILVATFLVAFGGEALAEISPLKTSLIRIGITDQNGTTLGIGFLPPDEDGWKETRSGLNVSLEKEGKLPGESQQIEAYLINIDVPISPISGYLEKTRKNIQENFVSNKRFKIAALEVTEDPKDKRCARVHLLLEDVVAPQESNINQRKWSEQYVLSCGSLKYKKFGFEVRYYQRYFDSNKNPEFTAQALKILDSTVIEDK